MDFRGRWPPTNTASLFLLIICYCHWAPATQASWCDIHQSAVRLLTKFAQFTKCDVHQFPVRLLTKFTQFTNFQWGYSPSSPSSPSVTFTNLQCVLHQVRLLASAPFTDLHCNFYKCTIHWSPLQLLQVHRSPISTVDLLQLHHPVVNLHLLATILCDYATRWLSDSVIMLPINNLATDVNTLVEYLSAS